MKKFVVEITKGARSCLECGRKIEKNTSCLAFKYGSSYYSVSANLCRVCILTIQEEMYQFDIDLAKKSVYKKLTKEGKQICIKS